MSMTENEKLEEQIAGDLSAVLKEAREMGCKEIAYFRHIPLQNIETVVKALEEIQRYRAIGTVEELKSLKESSLTALKMADIWCLLEDLKEYSAIGTKEECRTAVERMKPRKLKK